jgi:hypothetical protein
MTAAGILRGGGLAAVGAFAVHLGRSDHPTQHALGWAGLSLRGGSRIGFLAGHAELGCRRGYLFARAFRSTEA